MVKRSRFGTSGFFFFVQIPAFPRVTKNPVQTSPWTFNVWSPSPGFMFMMGVFIPLFELWRFGHRFFFRSARCFLKSVGNLKKISIVCNQILQKKKQSFARKFVGCFFLRMEGGSKPGELSVEMGCHLEGDISASAPRLVKISRLNSLRSATMARLLMALGVAMMAPWLKLKKKTTHKWRHCSWVA